MPILNFELRDPLEITPWGTAPETYISWFIKGKPYTDYYIVRFLEDFTSLFSVISEPIPDELYQIARSHFSLYGFYREASAWLGKKIDEESLDVDLHYDKYLDATQWIDNRRLPSGYLKNGPEISFFRSGDKVSIVWNCDSHDENNVPVWTAGKGEIEMQYDDFVVEVKKWGERFFAAMEMQIKKAFERDWGSTVIDKTRIEEEQIERQQDFDRSTIILTESRKIITDWSLVNVSMKEM